MFLFFQPAYHFLLALGAAVFYGFPARHLKVIGVTGTKGKTTVVELLHEILEEVGFKTASLSSLRFKISQKETRNDFKMTMPGRFLIKKFVNEAVKSGCQYAILEVTSEGIKQFRHRFINFSTAVVTNVSPEHIEAHGSFERYLRAKLDLFWRLPAEGNAIVNLDDPNFKRFFASTGAHKVFYGKDAVEIGDRRYAIRDVEVNIGGINFDVNGVTLSSALLGEFNFYNILAALALSLNEHVALEKVSAAVSKVKNIPGRMEFIQKEPFAVVVDYAHTPDSLLGVYKFLKNHRPQATNHKLMCVLGAAGGGRDKWKRPEFGKIAAEFCDEIILTNEDPYDENPQDILHQIESGFSQALNSRSQILSSHKILDRREAIREALKSAKSGDTVVITGKGAEPWIMGPGGEKIPWDDREIVREELLKGGG